MRDFSAGELRTLVNDAIGNLYSAQHKGVFRINAARQRGNDLVVLIDAALDLDGDWVVERVVFDVKELGALRGPKGIVFREVIQGRIDAAIAAMESKAKSAGRPFVPLSLLTGPVAAKG
jgi:hypothetical protein